MRTESKNQNLYKNKKIKHFKSTQINQVPMSEFLVYISGQKKFGPYQTYKTEKLKLKYPYLEAAQPPPAKIGQNLRLHYLLMSQK